MVLRSASGALLRPPEELMCPVERAGVTCPVVAEPIRQPDLDKRNGSPSRPSCIIEGRDGSLEVVVVASSTVALAQGSPERAEIGLPLSRSKGGIAADGDF